MYDKNKIRIPYWKKQLHYLLLKLEGKFSKWRNHIVIDPEIHFWISSSVKQANAFLNKIYINDNIYRSARYDWVEPEEAKKLFLYGCVRQVMKANISLLENADHVLDIPKNKNADTFDRIITEAIVDAQNIILRKHIELLINLINFSGSNKGEVYRIFLSAENLRYFIGRQLDFKKFYESESSNTESSIGDFINRIKNDLSTLGISSIWFLTKDYDKKNNPRTFESISHRFLLALSKATDDEKIVIGVSYDGIFADLSNSAHPSAGNPINERHQKIITIRKNISFIALLGHHIINRANRLMGFTDVHDPVDRMYKSGTSNASMLMQRNKKVFYPGDLVFAMGDLCEVIRCKRSKCDYVACQVKFLTKPPLPEIPDDWLPSRYIISILPKSKVRDFMFGNENYIKLPEEVKNLLEKVKKESDSELVKYSTKALINMHKNGILIPALLKSGYLKRRDLDE